MNLEAIRVAHHEQRRVLEVFSVVTQLAIGGREVLLLALVLPREEAALPDVGEAVAAAELLGERLEAVPLALRIGLGGRLLTEQLAEIEEVLLRRGAFLQLRCSPLLDEGFDRGGTRQDGTSGSAHSTTCRALRPCR